MKAFAICADSKQYAQQIDHWLTRPSTECEPCFFAVRGHCWQSWSFVRDVRQPISGSSHNWKLECLKPKLGVWKNADGCTKKTASNAQSSTGSNGEFKCSLWRACMVRIQSTYLLVVVWAIVCVDIDRTALARAGVANPSPIAETAGQLDTAYSSCLWLAMLLMWLTKRVGCWGHYLQWLLMTGKTHLALSQR